jgi:TetR/AcrR family transcriptional regulator, regulator of cefoperazone and chloramphenicol sensitivity
MGARDQETRGRLLQSAARLFADRGFAKVTVRDICRRARANVAAVNYHFGGKRGLYHAVLREAIRAMQATTAAARAAGEGQPAAEQLGAYVRVFVERVTGPGRESWIHQLMMRELSDPTPALAMVMTEVVQPRVAYLSGIIAELLDCAVDDSRVSACVLSVQAQCLSVMRSRVAALGGADPATPEQIAAAADHIRRFSLAGIASLKSHRV